jgi:hypothetical protein
MAKTHTSLEVVERRIAQEELPGFAHVALVSGVPPEQVRQIQWEESDDEHAARYRTVCQAPAVPAFWPPRPWDQENDRLSPADSDRLANRLADQKDSRTVAGAPPTRSVYRHTRARHKHSGGERIVMKFSVSKLDFSTDDFDEKTDGEF